MMIMPEIGRFSGLGSVWPVLKTGCALTLQRMARAGMPSRMTCLTSVPFFSPSETVPPVEGCRGRRLSVGANSEESWSCSWRSSRAEKVRKRDYDGALRFDAGLNCVLDFFLILLYSLCISVRHRSCLFTVPHSHTLARTLFRLSIFAEATRRKPWSTQ